MDSLTAFDTSISGTRKSELEIQFVRLLYRIRHDSLLPWRRPCCVFWSPVPSRSCGTKATQRDEFFDDIVDHNRRQSYAASRSDWYDVPIGQPIDCMSRLIFHLYEPTILM